LARARAIGLREGAYLDTEVYSFAERQRPGFFNEIIRPQGVASRIVAHLAFRGQPTATIYLCSEHRTGSSTRKLERVRRLLPALSLAHAAVRCSLGAIEPSLLDNLTHHQRRIAEYVGRGYQNKEMAILLQISPNTVRNALVVIFNKMRVANRAQL